MSVSQIRSVMRGYIETVGEGETLATSREFSGVMTYRWSNHGQCDADVGQAVFVKGKVVDVRFYSD